MVRGKKKVMEKRRSRASGSLLIQLKNGQVEGSEIIAGKRGRKSKEQKSSVIECEALRCRENPHALQVGRSYGCREKEKGSCLRGIKVSHQGEKQQSQSQIGR